jgi:L-aspartate oxidase
MNGAMPAVRGLPAVRPRWRREADVVVVGSGAAGISAALTAAGRGLRVLLVTKELEGGATPLAQGGLAAAIGPGDSAAAHAADTLTAGAGLCEPEVVAALAAGAPAAIGWLAGLGAQLERRALRLEGGHSRPRVAHHGDATGAEVHRALRAALLASAVEVLDRTVALDLIPREPGTSDWGKAGTGERRRVAAGPTAANADPDGGQGPVPVPARDVTAGPDRGTGRGMIPGPAIPAYPMTGPECDTGLGVIPVYPVGGPERGAGRGAIPGPAVGGIVVGGIRAGGGLDVGVISAAAVVLAAGGLGQAFATTSNPAGATGDALAIAARAGAVLRDPEFVQFHPTVLWLPGVTGQCPLITEALRGAGAVLRDLDGRPLMAGQHPLGDLAPRDIVAARLHEVITTGDAGHVWLDGTGLGRDLLEDGFPTVTAACRKHGIDPVAEPIPVAPGAHYSCGGVLAGLDGRTSVAGLYAAGEAASTGVQGANRLASNSVTEAIIAGRRTGEAIARAVSGSGRGRACEDAGGREREDSGGGWVSGGNRARLAVAMAWYAGVMRDSAGLRELVRMLFRVDGAVESGGYVRDKDLDLGTVEATNLHAVSTLIAVAALRREESRGCHRRQDAPATAAAPWHTLLRWDGRRLAIREEAQ